MGLVLAWLISWLAVMAFGDSWCVGVTCLWCAWRGNARSLSAWMKVWMAVCSEGYSDEEPTPRHAHGVAIEC